MTDGSGASGLFSELSMHSYTLQNLVVGTSTITLLTFSFTKVTTKRVPTFSRYRLDFSMSRNLHRLSGARRDAPNVTT